MREIKYRAWNPLERRMKQVGAIDWCGDYKVITCNLDDDKWYNGCNNYDFILMLYTGFKDKNNNEIYEGDIIYNEEFKMTFIVVWCEEDAGLYIKRIDTGHKYMLSGYANEFVVIKGNKYENPGIFNY
jgi:uncharacterized phage protein (TIGR01671 family)